MHDYLCRLRLGNLLWLLLALWLPLATAAEADSKLDDWLGQARQGLEELKRNLGRFDVQTGDVAQLAEIARAVVAVKQQGMRIIEDLEAEQANVKAKLDTLGPAPAKEAEDPPEVAKSRRQLNRDMKELERQVGAVRTMLLVGDDLLKGVSDLEQAIVSERLLNRGPNVAVVVRENLGNMADWWPTTAALLRAGSGLDVLADSDLSVIAVLVLLAVPVGMLVGRRLRPVAAVEESAGSAARVLAAARACAARRAPLLLPTAAWAGYLSTAMPLDPVPLVTQMAYAVLLYLVLTTAVGVLLHPAPPATHYLPLDEAASHRLARRLRFLIGLGAVGFMLFGTPLVEQLPYAQYLSLRAIYLLFVVGNVIWVIALLGSLSGWGRSYRVRGALALTFIAALMAELLGYRNLAVLLLGGMIGTLAIVAVALLFAWGLDDLFDGLDKGRRAWQARLRASLGLEAGDPFPGLLWLRLGTTLLVWGLALAAILKTWGLSGKGLAYFSALLVEGFKVGNITVVPTQILGAVLVFAVLLSAGNWFKQRLVPRWLNHTRLDRGAREAMTTISGYLGVTLATLMGLSVAGVSFENLAIIAGALSVGIGFGLQNVVSNFVSGVILLFERPIRTGDWVVVGGTEGYVKQISIRSTTIQTFDRADVIVPNSELLSTPVTNWMLRDSWGRVKVPIGVGYDSDPEQVERVLLAIAHDHPLTLTDSRGVPPPRVLFRAYGDSAMNFELIFFVRNVDARTVVISDVNHAIYKAFRAAGITIPYPQRDVNVHYVNASAGGRDAVQAGIAAAGGED